MMHNTPALNKTLADYEQGVNKAKEYYKEIYRLAELARQELSAVEQYLEPGHFARYNMPRIEDLNQEIDRRAWRRTIMKSGFSQAMDAQAMKEFDDSLERNPPVFSAENARATIVMMSHDAEMMFNRGLVKLFQQLQKKYKSHDAFKVQKKSIIENCRGWGCGISVYRHDLFNDIDRVLKICQGLEFKPYHWIGELETAIKSGEDYKDDAIQVKFFANGNAHLIIHNEDLLFKINAIIAKWYGEALAA